MGKDVIRDEQYQQYLKNFAELLAATNPKPSEEELQKIRERIAARRNGAK